MFQDLESESFCHSGDLAQLQQMKAIGNIVLIFGALPQIIKLYAMRGIPGTQISASIYLGSFEIIEVTMSRLNGSDARRPSTREYFGALGTNVQHVNGKYSVSGLARTFPGSP